jgi:response regulator NasT
LNPVPNRQPLSAALEATRIMTVSNDVSMSAELSSVLRAAGYTVAGLASPEQALEACTSQTFNMAIVDEAVCQKAGPELARALRDFFSVPTLFISEYNDSEILTAAIDDGSLGFIVKPLHPGSLLSALQIALARARAMQLKTPRNDLRRYVYAYWQQLVNMGSKLFAASDTSSEIDAAIARSRSIRSTAQTAEHNQDAGVDRIANPAGESHRDNLKH